MAAGIDGVVRDFDTEEVGQRFGPGQSALACAFDDVVELGVGRRRDGVGRASDDELAVGDSGGGG